MKAERIATIQRARILRDIRRLLVKMGASKKLLLETMATAASHTLAELKRDEIRVRTHYEHGKRIGTWAIGDWCARCGGRGVEPSPNPSNEPCRRCGGSGDRRGDEENYPQAQDQTHAEAQDE